MTTLTLYRIEQILDSSAPTLVAHDVVKETASYYFTAGYRVVKTTLATTGYRPRRFALSPEDAWYGYRERIDGALAETELRLERLRANRVAANAGIAALDTNAKCECEHDAHSTFGRTDHVYAGPLATTTVVTDYGTFRICAACAERGHMKLTSTQTEGA